MNKNLRIGSTCGTSSGINIAQLEQDLECTENFLIRNKEVKKLLLELQHNSSYEVSTLLNAPLGRVIFEISMNKNDIKRAKKSIKKLIIKKEK